MRLYIDNHKFHYEMENVMRLFFHNEKVEIIKDSKELISPYIVTKLEIIDNQITIKVIAEIESFSKTLTQQIKDDCQDDLNEQERIMAVMLYDILVEYTQIKPSWGIVTGVRPVKLFRSLINEGGIEYAKNVFKNKYIVSDEKLKLTIQTEFFENKIINLSKSNSYSLYISIPFCPSRCSYCSFVAQSIEKAKNLIEPYFDCLCEEIIYTAKIVAKLNLNLESVYIGGGTPTTLTHTMLSKLISVIKENYDLSNCREFTIEAGRPDTITQDKLLAIYNGGVDRISINPQTLNDEVLSKIGRNHTAQEALDAFDMARQIGFKHINTDLIIGLPDESLESFKNTLDKILLLSPESITIHTLSMKKSSRLSKENFKLLKEGTFSAQNMSEYAYNKLKENEYNPYYLYRQSRMVGNLENVGWSLKNKEGIYNVFVMDETHTIIGCGAGGVTKLKNVSTKKIERIFNYKFPHEYIKDFEEILRRKDKIEEFYQTFS